MRSWCGWADGIYIRRYTVFPIKGIVWVAQNLKDMAEAEMTDESKIHEDLMEPMRLELNDNEEEYQKRENDYGKA